MILDAADLSPRLQLALTCVQRPAELSCADRGRWLYSTSRSSQVPNIGIGGGQTGNTVHCAFGCYQGRFVPAFRTHPTLALAVPDSFLCFDPLSLSLTTAFWVRSGHRFMSITLAGIKDSRVSEG